MPTDVETLMEMGFSGDRARRAMAKTGYKGVQVAMDWCFAHDGDADVDDPFEGPKGYSLTDSTENAATETAAGASSSEAGGADGKEGESKPEGEKEAKSLKCDDCGKILRNVDEAEFHAVRSGHSNFSESVEEKKQLTAEEKAQQLEKVQERIKQKRQERDENDKKERIEKEKLRRLQGRDMGSAKAKFEEGEIRRMAELRRKEKEDDKRARQKIKDEIEKDKRDRAVKFAKKTDATSPPPAEAPKPAAAKTTAPKDYTETRLQIRLPGGQALTNTFGAKEELAAVRLYIEMNRKDGDTSPVKLMVSFPRKVFTEDDMQKPLVELGLVPSAVLIVTKAT